MRETNTLIIYRIAKGHVQDVLRGLGASVTAENGLVRWIQLGFMRRILAVFESPAAAAAALATITELLPQLPGTEKANVGFSIHNVDDLSSESHLPLPAKGRLLFVSPPPSPPNEWAESLEEEPNTKTNYEEDFNLQLTRALKAVDEPNSPTSPVSPISPIDSSLSISLKDGPEPGSPRIVTIIEAQADKPALQITHDDDDAETE